MLIAIWNMLTTGCLYDDLGGDYYTRLAPRTRPSNEPSTNSASMGYNVTLTPRQPTSRLTQEIFASGGLR